MKKFIKAFTVLMMAFVFQSHAGEKVDKTLALNGAKHVSIENLRGQVKIIGWEKDEVHVKGEIDDKAERFIFEQKGSYINVKVEMPRHYGSGWNDHGSDLVIHLPTNVRVDFTGVSSDVNVKNLTNSAEIKTVSGNIKVANLSNHVMVNAVSGNVNSKNLSGEIELSTVSGNISDQASKGKIEIKAVSGNLSVDSTATDVSLNTVSGEMEFSLQEVDDISITTVSGDADGTLALNDNGRLKLSSVSGDMTIGFTNDVQASFRIKSNASGDLVNKLTDEEPRYAKYGPSSKLYFETGNASATVKGNTVSGEIKVYPK